MRARPLPRSITPWSYRHVAVIHDILRLHSKIPILESFATTIRIACTHRAYGANSPRANPETDLFLLFHQVRDYTAEKSPM